MTTFKYLTIALLLAPLMFFTACQGGADQQDAEAEEAPASEFVTLTADQAKLAGIEVGRAEKRSMSASIGCTAYVDVPPYSLASVYAPVQGFVQEVTQLPGEFVKKGSVLTRLQHPDMVKLQQSFLESYSRMGFLEKEYARKKTLASTEAAATRDVEAAAAALAQEKATYKGLRAQLQMFGIPTDRLEAGGDIQTTIALTAPISGYISQVNVNRGKLVGPTDLLYEIVDNNHVHLELNVFAKDVPLLRVGQRIEAEVPGSDAHYTATVHLVGKTIEMENKTVSVHGHFTKEPVPLLPGTYLQARVFTDETAVWAVPEGAIVREGENTFVFVKHPEGFSKMPVMTAPAVNGYVALPTGEDWSNKELVVKGAYYLNE